MAAGVRRLAVGALAPDINNALLIGVIIAKQDMKIFISKKDGEERGVWNFTLRDSLVDTINITFWGTGEGVRRTYEMFDVGDVVEVINPRISFRQPGSADEFYRPQVSSVFQLAMQEHSSELIPHLEEDTKKIQDLIYIPIKSKDEFFRLSDILSYGKAMENDFVNLLVAIRSVEEVRSFKSKKDSSDMICRDVIVMDQSHTEFHITLWREDDVKRAEKWRPRETIIFFADVRLAWNTFRKGMTASITSRTVITVNPKTAEANALKDYAKTAPIQATAKIDYLASTIVDATNITSVMSTAQILDRAYQDSNIGNHFTALLFAMVTHLNLDGPESVVTYKCCRCGQILDPTFCACMNLECPVGSGAETTPPEVVFDLRVSLTDHRGSLHNCRLVSPVAEKVLECSVEDYLSMRLEEKTRLKWRLLLTRCEARVLVLCASAEHSRPLISLLACKPANPADVSSRLPIY